MRHFKRRPFQRLITGGTARGGRRTSSRSSTATCGSAWRAGSRSTWSGANGDQVLAAAQPLFTELEREREAAALERLGERGAKGLGPVLRALNERRVETLLLAVGFSTSGVQCPACGWLGPPGETSCPADGAELLQLDDITDPAIELALQQAAQLLGVQDDEDSLAGQGGIAALLRF